jgi:hypothetical protein
MLSPAHKTTWKNEPTFWPFNDKVGSLILIPDDNRYAAKWREISCEEKVENVKKDAY